MGSRNGINGAGQIVGDSETAAGDDHAFLWNGTSVLDLGTFGGHNSIALATSATGQAVGCADTTGGRAHPFRYQGGVATGPPPAGGDDRWLRDLGEHVRDDPRVRLSSVASQRLRRLALARGAFTIVPKVNGQCIITGRRRPDCPISISGGHIANSGQVVGSVSTPPTTGNPVPVGLPERP